MRPDEHRFIIRADWRMTTMNDDLCLRTADPDGRGRRAPLNACVLNATIAVLFSAAAITPQAAHAYSSTVTVVGNLSSASGSSPNAAPTLDSHGNLFGT